MWLLGNLKLGISLHFSVGQDWSGFYLLPLKNVYVCFGRVVTSEPPGPLKLIFKLC